MSSSRQLAVIMFTDIVGYTALMGKDSTNALELIRNSREIQKPLVEKYNGKWLKEMGDGAMAMFSTALDAVHCSLEIQKQFRAKLDAKLRVGIHLGDITIEDEDIYGDGVNVASRLENIADAGGIYISDNVEKAIQGQTDMETIYLGEVELKNVAYRVRTYALQGEGLPTPRTNIDEEGSKGATGVFSKDRQGNRIRVFFITVVAAIVVAAIIFYPRVTGDDATVAAATPAADNSIAVLYFENMSDDPDQEYFCDGMTDEIITQLFKIDGIRVAPRGSTRGYRDQSINAREIGEKHGVSYILDGGVRKANNLLRITAQLINAASGEIEEVFQYDKELTAENTFQIQGDIARDIARWFEVDISPEMNLEIGKIRTGNIEAYDNYLLGKHIAFRKYSWRGFHDSVAYESAKMHYERAIELDPDLAEAYAGLADLLNSKSVNNGIPLSKKEDSLRGAYIDIAFKLEPDNSFINSIMAWQVARKPGYNRDSAYYYAKRAFLFDPNNPDSYRNFGVALSFFYGLTPEGVRFLEKGLRLSPVDPNLLTSLAFFYSQMGEYEKAKLSWKKARAIDGDSNSHVEMRFDWALVEGDYDRAERILNTHSSEGRRAVRRKAVLFALNGQPDSARYLKEKYNLRNVHLFQVLGMKEEMYQHIEEYLSGPSNVYHILANAYYLKSHRNDPEYKEVIFRAKEHNDANLAKVRDMMVWVE